VLGVDAAGIVAEVGPGVTNLKKGDRVVTMLHLGKGISTGCYQAYSIATAEQTGKIPDNISFEQAATIPLGLITVVVGFKNLGLAEKQVDGESLLVWGGSSSVGAFAVQYAKMLGYTVFATASPHNHEYVKSLGADHVFDHKDTNVAEQIRDATNGKLKLAFDAISENGTTLTCTKALSSEGGRVMVVNASADKFPENIQTIMMYAADTHNGAAKEIGKRTWANIEEWLRSGVIKPNPVKIMENGLLDVERGFELQKQGKVSGQKLVYSIKN
jgi:NADPH:quinone reductase-like Zn-dependent oxidoreductase